MRNRPAAEQRAGVALLLAPRGGRARAVGAAQGAPAVGLEARLEQRRQRHARAAVGVDIRLRPEERDEALLAAVRAEGGPIGA